ncbi:MAG: DUF2238 domain-containing protein [Nitrospirota bacterium]|nr:DUF2238 domain-containing protein [Nitrospirota bacterium]MDE3225392.1 DUF2238 domain-containing protein [Nitrospirota bacterium]MDE3242568.1 DUF2238 domain-containing protein [Nitrospirota bacterium]
MTAWPTRQGTGDVRHTRLLAALLGWYLLLWAVMAISPLDRRDWFLENILSVALVAVLAVTYRRFPFSLLSYGLMTVFLTLHTVAAHYTYSEVPAGSLLKDAMALERNHFDRVAHFAFGLLMTYPLREFLVRTVPLTGLWSYVLPAAVLLAMSGLFEIIESWVAQIVSPELGHAYLGTQGDIWDAQQDMTVALCGAILCMAVTAILHRLSQSQFKLGI